ncbi:hypothetical protein CHELA40_12577 [Chelatococcus asaccharovorans]|nr:hypothetical protein CHELA40_12577 [Chelatococcus asaccharovorans]CAH1682266.1 hypothetical protein CHELA17_63037 [Chelatococcus asaccharovorans]
MRMRRRLLPRPAAGLSHRRSSSPRCWPPLWRATADSRPAGGEQKAERRRVSLTEELPPTLIRINRDDGFFGRGALAATHRTRTAPGHDLTGLVYVRYEILRAARCDRSAG